MVIKSNISRRDFLKASAMAAVGALAASCAQPEAVVVEKPVTVVVEKEVPIEKEVVRTVVVEKEVSVPKDVVRTVVVEKEIVVEREVTATPIPTKFFEAPMLADQVKLGRLPPVDDRLPVDPAVVNPVDEIGQYGGTWRRSSIGLGDLGGSLARVVPSEGLITWGTDGGSIVPNVASKWEITDGGATFLFYLRRGMKWSDGEPYTADDFVYRQEDMWLNTEISPSYPGWLRMDGEPMVMEKIDDYAIALKFKSPYGLLPLLMSPDSGWAFPAHYLKQFHAKYADKAKLDQLVKDANLERWDQLHGQKTNFRDNKDLPGIRPWLMVQGPPDTVIIHERNPYYWKVDPQGNQLPYLDRVRHLLVENAEMVNLKGIAGELDMQMRNIAFTNYPLLMENADKGGYDVYLWNVFETGVCVFPNQTLIGDDVLRDLMRDVRFRKALQLAIDVEEVNELNYLGLGEDMTSTVPEPLKSDPSLFEERTYNPDRANALLDEMGLDQRSSAGWRLRPDGQELSLTIEGLIAWLAVTPVCELIISYWQKVGINAAFKPITYDLWWDRIYTSEYQVAGYLLENADTLVNLTYPRNYFVTEQSCYWAPEWGYWYQTGGVAGQEPEGEPRRLQQLYDKVKGVVDPAEQADIMKDAFRSWLTNFWTVHTVGRYPNPLIVNKKFKNVPRTGINTWPLRSPAYTRPEQYWLEQ